MVWQTVTCKECGKTVTKQFKEFRVDRVVCSEECRRARDIKAMRKAYKKRKENKEKTTLECPYCHKEFIKDIKHIKYCSDACRLNYYRKNGKYNNKPKSNQQQIADLNKKAKEMGMSYGQYVAYLKDKFT